MSILGRVLYGVVIFVILLSTLESLGDLVEDLSGLPRSIFHGCTIVVASALAVAEAWKEFGIEKLREIFTRPDHVVFPSPLGEYEWRRAYRNEVVEIHALATRIYGGAYQFSVEKLERWYDCNPDIFFLAKHNGECVGYIDAFPISRADFTSLSTGAAETSIEPQRHGEAKEESLFYFASVVVSPRYSTVVDLFLRKSLRFYQSRYSMRPWTRICALAETANGKNLALRMGFSKVRGATVPMFEIQAHQVAAMTPRLARYWKRLFA